MKFRKTEFDNLLLVEFDNFEDERGYLSKFYEKESLKLHNIKFSLTQVKFTYTKTKGTIRGLHFQSKPFEEDKLVKVLRGEIFEVALDIRKNSQTYGKYFYKKISFKDNLGLFIPKGFAHGHQSLSDNCEILYLLSNKYSIKNNFGFRWNDPSFNIKWPIKPTIIAKKDRNWPIFK